MPEEHTQKKNKHGSNCLKLTVPGRWATHKSGHQTGLHGPLFLEHGLENYVLNTENSIYTVKLCFTD